jgi:hypothetical protein
MQHHLRDARAYQTLPAATYFPIAKKTYQGCYSTSILALFEPHGKSNCLGRLPRWVPLSLYAQERGKDNVVPLHLARNGGVITQAI